MFRIPNAIQISAVRSSSDEGSATPTNLYPSPDDVAEYATIAGYWSKQAAKGVAVLYVGKKVVDTAQQIAIVAATAHLTK